MVRWRGRWETQFEGWPFYTLRRSLQQYQRRLMPGCLQRSRYCAAQETIDRGAQRVGVFAIVQVAQ